MKIVLDCIKQMNFAFIMGILWYKCRINKLLLHQIFGRNLNSEEVSSVECRVSMVESGKDGGKFLL